MAAKQGERHHLAKLTEDDVRDIRRRRAEGETLESIWLSFPHISEASTIGMVARRETWRHVK